MHVFEPIVEALLPLWLTFLQNMLSERINRFFRCRKTVTSPFFTYGNKKTIRRMTHQIDVSSAQKCSCLSRCLRARIVVVKSDPSSVVGFPDFLGDNWQTNGCVPFRIDCSTLLTWYDCDMSFFVKKTGDQLLGSASCKSNCCWI